MFCSISFLNLKEIFFLKVVIFPDFIDNEKNCNELSGICTHAQVSRDEFFLSQNGKTDISGLGGCSSCYLIIYHRQNSPEELMQHQVL